MRIERGLNVRVLELLEKLLPLLISLASVCVATAAVLVTLTGRQHLCERQMPMRPT